MRLLPFVSIENRQLHLSHTNNRWRSGRGVAVALGRRVNTPQIAYRVAICPRGNLPYIQITYTGPVAYSDPLRLREKCQYKQLSL